MLNPLRITPADHVATSGSGTLWQVPQWRWQRCPQAPNGTPWCPRRVSENEIDVSVAAMARSSPAAAAMAAAMGSVCVRGSSGASIAIQDKTMASMRTSWLGVSQETRIVQHEDANAGYTVFVNYYIRFGKLPKSGRSGVSPEYQMQVLARTGMRIPKREKGVSVYRAKWDGRRRKWVMPTVPWDSYVIGMDVLLMEACDGKIPVYLVTGAEVGEGQDGEPLLANVSIIEEIDVRDLWNDEAMRGSGWNPDWECKKRRR